MMKPKQTIPQPVILWGAAGLLVIAGIAVLAASFGGGRASLDDVNIAYTKAAETVAAQQLTLQASEPTATPTFTLTATMTLTPFDTPTVFIQTGLASPTTAFLPGGAAGCDNSAFVTDVTVPDYTPMTPGQAFTKTWRLQNNGTCAWTTAYRLTHVSGNPMGGAATALTQTVNPGGTIDISVNMIAPTAPGEHRGDWRLVNASGQPFGTNVYVIIRVGAATPPTATLTPNAATSTPTATPVTPTPTEGTPAATPEG